MFPPTYEVLEFLGPAPKASKPLNHLPPRENLLSDNISVSFKEKILPALPCAEKIFLFIYKYFFSFIIFLIKPLDELDGVSK